MTILVDEAYEKARQRSAQWAEQQVRRRFAKVYGTQVDGDKALAELVERMNRNIQSDGRADASLSEQRDSDG